VPFEDAFKLVLDASGTHFDPQIVAFFERSKEELKAIRERVNAEAL
jgi:HD-GYP domain-containing protein (c-di-GMP phosphodiesterase class II)